MANHQKSNYYGYQGENNNCCPPNKIFPNDLFQSENQSSVANFNNDPLSGFNSMTSSYSSQGGDNNSSPNYFEELDGIICHGKEQGYFNNPIIVDPEQHQQHHYVPYTEPVYTTYEVSNTIVIQDHQHHQHIYYENASVGSRSYSSDQNERTSSPENYLPPPPKYSNFQNNNSSRQISQDIGDILGDVDEYIKNSSSSNSPGSDQTWTPEIQYSPPPTKKQKINNDNADNEKEEEIPVATSSKKERRKATNRKASANYRAKQVKSRNAKGAKKLEQEEIQKKLELDNHAIKMQIEYMMKTFSQRIKQTQ